MKPARPRTAVSVYLASALMLALTAGFNFGKGYLELGLFFAAFMLLPSAIAVLIAGPRP